MISTPKYFSNALITLALWSLSSHASAYQVTGFGPELFSGDLAAMDAALGISSYAVEDFEDSTLVSGLTVEYTHTGSGPLTELPGLFGTDASFYRRNFSGHNWDGPHILYTVQPSEVTSALVFRIEGGTSSFGIGLSDYLTKSHTWQVNDGPIRTISEIPNVIAYDFGRNGYLRVDVQAGDELIRQVTFFHPASYDALEYDHLAFVAPVTSVDAPSTFSSILVAAGLGWVGGLARKRRSRSRITLLF